MRERERQGGQETGRERKRFRVCEEDKEGKRERERRRQIDYSTGVEEGEE